MVNSIMKKVLIYILLSTFPALSIAARDTWITEVMVESVASYNPYGINVITVKFSIPDGRTLNTSCGITNQNLIVSHTTSHDWSRAYQGHIAVLLSAQAQQIPVDLLIDPAICSSETYGRFANGVGALFVGVVANHQ